MSTLEVEADTCEVWTGCYSARWDGLLSPESFNHPAKFSRALIYRIVHSGVERGWWRRGSIVGDPMAGVGCAGIAFADAGIRFFGMEIEADFVKSGRCSLSMHAGRWRGVMPELLQGDSRTQFTNFVGSGRLDAVVTSPPWGDRVPSSAPLATGRQGIDAEYKSSGGASVSRFGATPGQIGRKGRGIRGYWSSLRGVYEQCWSSLRPGGVIVVVVRDYVRAGKRVAIVDRNRSLLRSIGFERVTEIKSMLVHSQAVGTDLFGVDVLSGYDRRGFLRKVTVAQGAPSIDFENILVYRRAHEC